MNPIVVRTYTDVYQKPIPDDHFLLLRPYPTDLIITCLAKINVLVFQEPNQTKQALKIFKEVFLPEGGELPPFAEKLAALMDQQDQLLFSVQSLSYLIRATLSNYKAIEDVEEDGDPRQFPLHLFDTILIYNSVVYDAEEIDMESYHGIWEITLRQQNYFRDFNALFYTAPVKFIFIRNFFNSTHDGRQLLLEFEQAFQLKNIWQFIHHFMELIKFVMPQKETGRYIFPKQMINPEILRNYSFDKNQPKKNLTIHMDIIPKPFYEVDGQHVAVLDFNYFRYFMDQGFFWCLYQHTSLKNRAKYPDFNAFNGALGLSYFEQFLVSQLLNSIFAGRHQVLIEKDKVREDFWIRPNQKDLLLIECKMTDLNPLTTEAFDTNKFEAAINRNFAQQKNGKKEKAKGIFQLERQLELLYREQTESAQLLKLKSLKNLNVYPVIVYSDQVFDHAGVNAYVAQQFEKIAAKYPNTPYRIRGLTLINVNSFINHYDNLCQNAGALTGLIASYHKYIRGKQKGYQKLGGATLFFQQNISFEHYVIQYQLGMGREKASANLKAFKSIIQET
jgi:hypothetical protein